MVTRRALTALASCCQVTADTQRRDARDGSQK